MLSAQRASDRRLRARWGFAVGLMLVCTGAGVHVAMYMDSADMDYRIHDMAGTSLAMAPAMVAVAVGVAVAAWSVFARVGRVERRGAPPRMEATHMGRAQWLLLGASILALAIDVMKPATIGFVLPGLREEYGISTSTASLLPLIALAGTALGSFLWGAIADRLGRQPSLMLAGLLFIGTSICGAMPTFEWNLAMCFVMGASAGGFLPVVLTLLTETTPRRLRGFVVVLVAGLGSTAGFLAASGLSTVLIPTYGWRIMWLIGLPIGLLLLAMRRLLPESYRFLRLTGRYEEAEAVARRFALVPVADVVEHDDAPGESIARSDVLVGARYRSLTIALGRYAVGWGLVNYGFFTWVPTMLSDANGGSAPAVDDAVSLIGEAAVIALPGAVCVAGLYWFWGAKRTLVLTASVTALGLSVFGGLVLVDASGAAMVASLVALIVAVNGMNALVLPYASEVFPTEVRARGTGVVAGAGKIGGVGGSLAIGVMAGLDDGASLAAFVLVLPVLAGIAAVAVTDIDMRRRPLLDHATDAGEATV